MMPGAKRKITPDEMVALHRRGITNVEIARRAGVSRERVRQILAKRGCSAAGNLTQRLELAVMRYEQGEPAAAASRGLVGARVLCRELAGRGVTRHRRPAAHGTANRYLRHGCRCKTCRSGNAARMRKYRKNREAMPIADVLRPD